MPRTLKATYIGQYDHIGFVTGQEYTAAADRAHHYHVVGPGRVHRGAGKAGVCVNAGV